MDFFTPGLLAELNYWAIPVVALLSFFLAGLWYSPAVFENAWMHANGYDEAQVKAIQSNMGVAGFASTFGTYVVMSLVLAVFARLVGADGIGDGLALGVLLWLGFVATFSLAVNLFSTRSLTAWLIDAGFQFVALAAGGVIFAVWR